MMRREKKEIGYLNLLRFAATYLVVALHCVWQYINQCAFGSKTWWACNILDNICRMAVPIFFMISGFLSLSSERTNQIKLFYVKRLKRVLIPFLCWDIIYFLTDAFFLEQPLTLHRFVSELVVQGSKYHLWFVYQILGIYLLTPFLKKIVDHTSHREQVLFFFLILMTPTVFSFINTVQSFLVIAPFGPLVEGYVGYFILGYILGTCQLTPVIEKIIYCGGVVGFLLGTIGNFWLSTTKGIHYAFNGGYFINHYLMAAALFLLVKNWFRREDNSIPALFKPFEGFIQLGAKLSFGIYLVHVLVLERLAVFLSFSPAWNIVVSFFATSALCTLIIFLLSILNASFLTGVSAGQRHGKRDK